MESWNEIGLLADKADNFLEYAKEPGAFSNLPLGIRLDALAHGLIEIRDALRKVYVEQTGENPWIES